MTLFEQILSEAHLLLEKQNEVSEDKIRDAIEHGKIVSMMYNDRQGGGGKSWRYIYPVVYGELKDRKTGTGNGHMAIRAFQPSGSSKRGRPAWKLFRVDRIVAWYNQENTENDLTHKFSKEDLGLLFNDKGDSHFHTITCHSPFMKVEYLIDAEPIKKSDIKTEPGETSETEPNTIKYSFNPDWKNQYNQENEKGVSLDNNGNVSYNSEKAEINKLVAPETKAITKDDVQPNAASQETSPEGRKLVADETPVTKSEVENGEDNPLTAKFNDMMNRWNNEKEENNSPA